MMEALDWDEEEPSSVAVASTHKSDSVKRLAAQTAEAPLQFVAHLRVLFDELLSLSLSLCFEKSDNGLELLAQQCRILARLSDTFPKVPFEVREAEWLKGLREAAKRNSKEKISKFLEKDTYERIQRAGGVLEETDSASSTAAPRGCGRAVPFVVDARSGQGDIQSSSSEDLGR